MNRIVDGARAALLSPEFLWSAVVLAAGLLFPDWIRRIGDAVLATDVPNVLPILGAPFGMAVAAYNLSAGILRPSEDRTLLTKWPDYWRLRLRVNVSLFYALLGALAVSVGWLAHRSHHTRAGAIIALAGFGVSAISLISVAHAKQDVADIVDGADN